VGRRLWSGERGLGVSGKVRKERQHLAMVFPPLLIRVWKETDPRRSNKKIWRVLTPWLTWEKTRTLIGGTR
jgi:hypothetical protein